MYQISDDILRVIEGLTDANVRNDHRTIAKLTQIVLRHNDMEGYRSYDIY